MVYLVKVSFELHLGLGLNFTWDKMWNSLKVRFEPHVRLGLNLT